MYFHRWFNVIFLFSINTAYTTGLPPPSPTHKGNSKREEGNQGQQGTTFFELQLVFARVPSWLLQVISCKKINFK
jgi:hypothetical protein